MSEEKIVITTDVDAAVSSAVKNAVKEQIDQAISSAIDAKQPTTVVSKIVPEGKDGDVSVEQIFLSSISTPQVGVRRSNADDSKLLFNMKEVNETSYPLAKIMRYILATYNTTHAEFDENHRIFGESSGFLSSQINYNRNNIKKAMFKDRISYQMFEQIILVIMGFGLRDMIFRLAEPKSNKVVDFSLTEIIKKMHELFGDSQLLTVDITTEDTTKQE